MNRLLIAALRYFFLLNVFINYFSSGKTIAQSCSNWLSLPSQGSKLTIGDVDVSGNQLTVEAMFNRKSPLNNGVYYGHLISKHTDESNVNYALLPNGCEITTTGSGYKAIFQTCLPELDKTYHVAMVYDGAVLKFYRNGFLMSEAACTGNIINNNLLTTIGQIARGDDPFDNQFLGYTNEVRIWNVARTQTQITTYMSQALPNPATQAGLVAYYSFNNLINKQGNAAFNGIISGNASFGQINPGCVFGSGFNQRINICEGESIKIGSPSTPGNYLWNNGAVTDSIIINAAGTYWVETSNTDCRNRDSFIVTMNPRPVVNLGNDKTVCTLNNLILDAGNAGASYMWNNGSTAQTIPVNAAGTYYVTVSKNSCSSSDTININFSAGADFDFNYKRDACNPLVLQFKGIGTTLTNSYWDFGDGKTIRGSTNPTHVYASTGAYLVKYSIKNGNCVDTVRKTILINVQAGNLIVTKDTTICYGSSLQLRTVPALSFCWTPVTYLNDPNSLQPVTSTKKDITYYFTAEVTEKNLIVNGNFSQGNTGFTSAYGYSPASGIAEGVYTVGKNVKAWHPNLSACADHTGNGNMMMINGASVSDVNMWAQTVSILPNTNYAFSTWIQSLDPGMRAQLQFSINGKNLGSMITASLPTCNWTQFYTTWNSGNNTTALISIVNKNTEIVGNDFALDDISFAVVSIKRDSVKVTVEKPVVRANKDTMICPASPVQLVASGAQTYSWTPATALSQTDISNPVASPVVSTKYIVAGTTVTGCIGKDTVMVYIYPRPAISITNDTVICKNTSLQLSASGGQSYVWTPAGTLNNPSISNPVATPLNNTTYFIAIKAANTCEYQDSVNIGIRPAPLFSISPPATICENESVQLTASGGDVYTWHSQATLLNTGSPNPWVSPSSDEIYTVTIEENTCHTSAILSTAITVLSKPPVRAEKSNDIDCSIDFSQLKASGAANYNWSPSIKLSNAAIANPVATPGSTIEYIVRGVDEKGCFNYDTIMVKVENKNKGEYIMPNAFSPNNDGLNDCYGIKYWGIIDEFEFSVYTRWGERIFFTKNAGQCWDGTYQGIKQAPGVYVFMIKAKTNCEAGVFRKGTFVLVR